jgi:hypothetical protein
MQLCILLTKSSHFFDSSCSYAWFFEVWILTVFLGTYRRKCQSSKAFAANSTWSLHCTSVDYACKLIQLGREKTMVVRFATDNILTITSEAGQSCWTAKNHSMDLVGCVDCFFTYTIIFWTQLWFNSTYNTPWKRFRAFHNWSERIWKPAKYGESHFEAIRRSKIPCHSTQSLVSLSCTSSGRA